MLEKIIFKEDGKLKEDLSEKKTRNVSVARRIRPEIKKYHSNNW